MKKLKEEKKNFETLSGIPIYNADDKTEIAVKNNLTIGEIFTNGMNEVYKTVGLDNLGVKSLNGGKQKQKAKRILSQYAIFAKHNHSKNAVQCTDIMETPIYLEEKEDNRGKHGAYIDKTIPLFINYFLRYIEHDKIISTNIPKLAKEIGMAGVKYKDSEYEKELKHSFTSYMINQFYCYCKPEQEEHIFRALDRLQNDFSIINYYKNFHIETNNPCNSHTSTKEEEIIIRNAQRRVLKEFGVTRIFTIFQRRKQKEFYTRVCELINQEHNFDWNYYRQQIQIIIDEEGLKDIAENYELTNQERTTLKNMIAELFNAKIQKKTETDYIKNICKTEEIENNYKDTIIDIFLSSTENELIVNELGTMLLNAPSYPKTFTYTKKYLEIQESLQQKLLYQPPSNNDVNWEIEL